jgi:signal transduction histidine kinase
VRRRLFWQIYTSFLLVALLSLGAAGLALRFVVNRSLRVGDAGRAAAALLVDGLPDPVADPAGFRRALAGRASGLGLHLSLWSAKGRLLGRVGAALPAPPEGCREPLVRTARGAPGLCLRLPDGRWVAVASEPAAAQGLALRGFGLLGAVLGAVAVGCYPLARRISGRLERLRDGVEDFGGGALQRRVAVEGDDEVAALARAFNEAAARVDALIAGQRRVLAHASHELRSPLARLQVAIALLDEEDVEDVEAGEGAPSSAAEAPARRAARAAALAMARRELDELNALIEDVLLASRLRGGALLPPRPEAVELWALCEGLADEAGARLDGGPALAVAADPRLLRRALANLLQNAARYGAPPVALGWSAVDGSALLWVQDAGAGVPEAERARIFEPFYQAPGRAEGEGGVGLGLSLVDEIARHHGASVWVEAAVGGGARFVLRWPLAGDLRP